MLSTGCQWQALPKDLPPKSTGHIMTRDNRKRLEVFAREPIEVRRLLQQRKDRPHIEFLLWKTRQAAYGFPVLP